jgi:hypothetical protein
VSRTLSSPRGAINNTVRAPSVSRVSSSIEENKLIAKHHKELAESRVLEKMKIAAEQGRIAEEKARERLQQKLASGPSRAMSRGRPIVSSSSKKLKEKDDSMSMASNSVRSERVDLGKEKNASPVIPTREVSPLRIAVTLSETIENNRVVRTGSMSSISSLSDSVFPNSISLDESSLAVESSSPRTVPIAPSAGPSSPRDSKGHYLQSIDEGSQDPSIATPPKDAILQEAVEEVRVSTVAEVEVLTCEF